MPTSVGPNTKGEENLVFGYDLGDVSNSYRGEPTENLITDTAAFDSSFWNQKSGTITANSVTGPRGIENAAKIVAVNTDPYIYSSAIVTASTGNVTWSIWVKGVGNTVGKSAEVRINFSGTATGTADTNASVNLTDGWQLLQTTANVTGAGTIKFGLEAPNGAVSGDIMYFADPMFEQKSHATQFTAGTRSATQGLLDLTGNSTIDLTDVSFDSSAEMTFDGSNDYVSVEYSTAINTPNGATYEIMVYPQGAGEFLTRGKSDSGTDPDNPRFYVGGNGNIYFDWSTTGADTYVDTVTGTATLNQWNHIVGVAQPGDQLRVYVNGVQASYGTVSRTLPATLPNTSDPIIIGGATWIPRYFTGKVGMVKLYNRNLTPTEIKENFNGIKSRYGI